MKWFVFSFLLLMGCDKRDHILGLSLAYLHTWIISTVASSQAKRNFISDETTIVVWLHSYSVNFTQKTHKWFSILSLKYGIGNKTMSASKENSRKSTDWHSNYSGWPEIYPLFPWLTRNYSFLMAKESYTDFILSVSIRPFLVLSFWLK